MSVLVTVVEDGETHACGADLRFCTPREVHVWRVELDSVPVHPGFASVLSQDEQSRAAVFKSADLRRLWTTARVALRMILARYTESSPAKLSFSVDSHGRPSLVGDESKVNFNLTHTGRLALVAVAPDTRVGVDAEIINPDIEWEELANRFFTPAETKDIGVLPRSRRVDAFFACWTRKEAFVKALGTGLSIPLDRFGVTVRPDTPARLLWVQDDFDEPEYWHLENLNEPRIAATLAVRDPSATVRRFDFRPPGA